MDAVQQQLKLLKDYGDLLKVLYIQSEISKQCVLCTDVRNLFKSFTIAGTFQEGIEMFQKSFFDIILVDIGLGHSEGVSVVEKIKTIAPKKNIIVIASRAHTPVLLDLINLDINGYILANGSTEKSLEILNRVCMKTHDMKMIYKLNDELLGVTHTSSVVVHNEENNCDNFIEFESEGESVIYSEPQESLTPHQLIDHYPEDYIEILGEKLSDILESFDHYVNSFVLSPSHENALRLSDAFDSLLTNMASVNEFTNLRDTIETLSVVIKNLDTTKEYRDYYDMFLGISRELHRWRDHIFDKKDVESIYFLDKSIATDCATLMQLLQQHPESDDTVEALEFF